VFSHHDRSVGSEWGVMREESSPEQAEIFLKFCDSGWFEEEMKEAGQAASEARES